MLVLVGFGCDNSSFTAPCRLRRLVSLVKQEVITFFDRLSSDLERVFATTLWFSVFVHAQFVLLCLLFWSRVCLLFWSRVCLLFWSRVCLLFCSRVCLLFCSRVCLYFVLYCLYWFTIFCYHVLVPSTTQSSMLNLFLPSEIDIVINNFQNCTYVYSEYLFQPNLIGGKCLPFFEILSNTWIYIVCQIWITEIVA